MNQLLPLFLAAGLPLLACVLLFWRIQSKRALCRTFLGAMAKKFGEAGAEAVGPDRYRFEGRVFRLEADINPLLSARMSLRLSTYCDTLHEFELKAAENVPLPRIPDDPFYSRFHLDGRPTPELLEYLRAVRETLEPVFPGRWTAFSKFFVEVILSGNRFDHRGWTADEVRADLRTLGSLASVPLARVSKGGIFTHRRAWEKDIPEWHWKPAQLNALPEGARRECVSYWRENSYLNDGLVQLFWRLAGGRRVFVLTDQRDLDFLEHAFGKGGTFHGSLFETSDPRYLAAADQMLDGEFFGGILVADDVPPGFEDVKRYRFHDAAVAALPGVHFYARRLFDDEFSWFSGEYEILSTKLGEDEIRGALDALAFERRADLRDLDRRFSFKLIRDELKLEMTV